ncbi:hypothetical protein ElyMa_000406000 [Elysia marginata]|uniref:Sushi domain-containing protein n=1 Tax=Elysia marginata TaxID=1093978 RepID=A0AAV4FLA5_9GAST|nr:hypothetical protein ElyMa_000406000 [Elysia marginata]
MPASDHRTVNAMRVTAGVIACGQRRPATDIYETTYLAELELACKPPLYQSVPDSDVNKTVVCQANGRWSTPDTKFVCDPCDQSSSAFSDPNGSLILATTSTTDIFAPLATTSITGGNSLATPSATDATHLATASARRATLSATISDTGTLICDTDFVLIGNAAVQCTSVQGKPTWLGLDTARCIRTTWRLPAGNVSSYCRVQDA